MPNPLIPDLREMLRTEQNEIEWCKTHIDRLQLKIDRLLERMRRSEDRIEGVRDLLEKAGTTAELTEADADAFQDERYQRERLERELSDPEEMPL